MKQPELLEINSVTIRIGWRDRDVCELTLYPRTQEAEYRDVWLHGQTKGQVEHYRLGDLLQQIEASRP